MDGLIRRRAAVSSPRRNSASTRLADAPRHSAETALLALPTRRSVAICRLAKWRARGVSVSTFAWAVLVLATASTQPVTAQQRIAVGPQGELGVWRVLQEARAITDNEASALDADQCDGCEAFADPEWPMDLRHATRQHQLALGVMVSADRATEAHLFVGCTGELAILVDGQRIARFVRGAAVEDEQHIAVPLSPGRHRVVLVAKRPTQGSWSLYARWLDADFRARGTLAQLDLGRSEGLDTAGLIERALAIHDRYRLPPLTVATHVGFPTGGPTQPLRVTSEGAAVTLTAHEGAWHASATVVSPVPTRGALPSLTVNGRSRVTGSELQRFRRLLLAAAELASRDAPAASQAPIRWRIDEALRAVHDEDRDARWRRWLEAEARRLIRALDRGEDPFATLSGYQRMAHRSALDGTAQPYELFVPPAYARGERQWPLVVTLHGFKGNAGDFFRNTFGLSRDWQHGETLQAHGRHGQAPTTGPMIVIAPEARGQTMYREAGEIDVLEAIADVQRRLRIDPRRIYITGGSMGGTGAAYLPLRNPDVFAAAAALAGYHDQRVRRDTHHAGLTEVERYLLARLSDVDWAPNARHLPMLLVRGQRDRPLAWTRSLVERLGALEFEVEHREPDARHNVWTETYADGAIFDYFARYQRPEAMRHIQLRTARERTRSSGWVTLDRARPDAFGEIDARVDHGRIRVVTQGVRAVVLDPPRSVVAEDPLEVVVDDQLLRGPRPLHLFQEGERWHVGRHTHEPLGRPIREVFHEPLVFVVGTADPQHTLVNRLTAEHWAHPEGWDVHYPIVDDRDLTAAMLREASPVFIGNPRSNSALARLAPSLPIRFEGDAVVVEGRRYRGAEVGAVFRIRWQSRPHASDRAGLVIAGVGPLGTWRSQFLPEALAEYVVFDERVANARGQLTCGGAKRDRVTGAGVGATANDSTHGGGPGSLHRARPRLLRRATRQETGHMSKTSPQPASSLSSSHCAYPLQRASVRAVPPSAHWNSGQPSAHG